MACKICWRNSCTSSFHSVEEQEKHDEQNERFKDYLERKISRMYTEEIESEEYIKLSDIEEIISYY